MSIYGEYSDGIYFINEHEELVSQRVMYDWKPIICGKCKEIDFEEAKCRVGEHRKRVNKPTPRPTVEADIVEH